MRYAIVASAMLAVGLSGMEAHRCTKWTAGVPSWGWWADECSGRIGENGEAVYCYRLGWTAGSVRGWLVELLCK